MILVLPLVNKFVENNLEYFFFTMGIMAVITSHQFSLELFSEIFENYFLYLLTIAVLTCGLLFEVFKERIKGYVQLIIQYLPLEIFIFLLTISFGLVTSIITAMIASLVFVEILKILPIKRQVKVVTTIITCFSIGLGAALTPIGEPLSTIVTSILKKDFFYLLRILGVYILPAILTLGLIELVYLKISKFSEEENNLNNIGCENEKKLEGDKSQGIREAFIRSFKIFVFVVALELLSTGFKPIVDNYIIHLDSRVLYWINMVSAVLDNATLAATEISPAMTTEQIRAILMGLLISGGMLIPGNIPNIVSAGSLRIKSREWARIGVPLGLSMMVIYYILIFMI